jgi:hypothetical protein
MEPVFFSRVQCPYCGEPTEMEVDGSAGERAYIEDCSVCCRPIEVHLVQVGDGWGVEVHRDDE